jgi:hypothetical protein
MRYTYYSCSLSELQSHLLPNVEFDQRQKCDRISVNRAPETVRQTNPNGNANKTLLTIERQVTAYGYDSYPNPYTA